MQNLTEVFQSLKQILSPYERYFTPRQHTPQRYELWSTVPVTINGKNKDSVFFSGLMIHQSYVGFYFMPVYVEQELTSVFGTELLRLKKGLSCFHIKTITPEIVAEIKNALAKGYELYKLRGWTLTTA